MTALRVRCLHTFMTTERISDHVKFAYWVPNVSGGLVTSTIEQRTDWGYDYNVKLARTAEDNGFEYALTQVRYEASYGAEYQHESTSFSLALLLATERLKVIAAVHPGLWQPGVLAKLGATADHLSGGRFAVNVVSGWFKDEFTHLGEPWLEHDERYRRSAEFLQVLRKIWTEDDVDFRGDFYRIHDFTLKPKPLHTPELFQGGNSTATGATAVSTPTGTSPTARTSPVSPTRSWRSGTTPAPSVARSISRSTVSSSPVTPRPKRATCCGRSSRRPIGPPWRASVRPFSRRVPPPVTKRECGQTPRSKILSNTTTDSVPSSSAHPSRSQSGSPPTAAGVWT